MANSTGKTVLKIVGGVGLAYLAITKGPKAWAALSRALHLGDVYNGACQAIDQSVGWDKLPTWPGLFTLIGVRRILREKNLYDTGTPTAAPPAPDRNYRTVRTSDGTYNDLKQPAMGMAGTRFGRNAPLDKIYPDSEAEMLSPSPRVVSTELFTRNTFQPATTLNVLAAAWLQFMIRDWFSHGRSVKENPWQIPLGEGDDWPQEHRPMTVLRTMPDPTRTDADGNAPPTHVNTETHWWDASHIYGSTQEYQDAVRTHQGGKLVEHGQVEEADPNALVQQQNLAGWWAGQAMLFTLFMREHNAICDHLQAAHPDWSDEELFQHARLVNAALLAKIHTVEWTTAILGHPALQIGMRTNWWGILGERIHKLVGRVSSNEVISGIPGSPVDHYNVPYSITEEFVAVYRMHPLIPDDYAIRSADTDALLGQCAFPEMAGLRAHALLQKYAMADLFYSFGVAHPGAVVLHNYPRALQRFERPDGVLIDLAAHDVMRVRELGVPRYNEFRRILHLNPARTFEELTPNAEWREEIRRVYDNDIERVDLMTGLYAEKFPAGFGFSDTAFRIFVLMASRRLNSDRFFTDDFTPEVYSPEGMKWIDDNTMSTVLLRHYPNLAPSLQGVQNAFAPWKRTSG